MEEVSNGDMRTEDVLGSLELPLIVVKPPTIAIMRSLAVSSTLSPRSSPTWGSLLKTVTDVSRERSQADAVVCSLTNGVAILRTRI